MPPIFCRSKYNIFLSACKKGDLEEVKRNEYKAPCCSLPCPCGCDNVQLIEFKSPFQIACENGHLEVAKWLYNVKFYDHNVGMIFRKICKNNNIEIAKWLYELGGVYSFDIEMAFCLTDNLEIAKWLCEIRGKYIGIKSIIIELSLQFISPKPKPHIIKWLLSSYSLKELQEFSHNNYIEEEIRDRKKTNVYILSFTLDRYKICDPNAISLIWKNYL